MRILMPIDLLDQPQRALDWLRLRLPEAQVRLLGVVDVATCKPSLPDRGLSSSQRSYHLALDLTRRVSKARRALKALAANRQESWEVRCGKPVSRIIEAAQDWRADMIIFNPLAQTSETSWVFPSIALEVMQHSHIPIMVVVPSASSLKIRILS